MVIKLLIRGLTLYRPPINVATPLDANDIYIAGKLCAKFFGCPIPVRIALWLFSRYILDQLS